MQSYPGSIAAYDIKPGNSYRYQAKITTLPKIFTVSIWDRLVMVRHLSNTYVLPWKWTALCSRGMVLGVIHWEGCQRH